MHAPARPDQADEVEIMQMEIENGRRLELKYANDASLKTGVEGKKRFRLSRSSVIFLV